MSIRRCDACKGDGFIFVPRGCGCREAICPHSPFFDDATDPSRGIYHKFWVRRTDGSSREGGKHEKCGYFVLDWEHDPFAIPAARAYANACEATHPELAVDLRDRADLAEQRGRNPSGGAP